MANNIAFANITDTEDIMTFMGEVWRKGHILSKNRNLLLHEFQEGNRLNFAIARNESNELIGLFGFIRYNSCEFPDLAGSLWKVDEKRSDQSMLGLKLRSFVMENIPHRFFAAPGAGLQTKPIYHFLKMNWNRMRHYYILNDAISDFKIAQTTQEIKNNFQSLEKNFPAKITKVSEMSNFPFEKYKNIAPSKDLPYVTKKYMEHTIRNYEIYILNSSSTECMFICREEFYQDRSAYRMVDYIGDESLLKHVARYLYHYIIKNNHEYVDFICHGFDHKNLIDSGFKELDLDSEKVIIPNHFGPFVPKNIPIYCVSDHSDCLRSRQCKADGDQDRPNH